MATSPCDNPPAGVVRVPGVLDYRGEIAPWVIGVPFTSILLGIIITQTVSYWGQYARRDKVYFSATTLVLLLGSLAIWGVIVSNLWYVSITSRDSDCNLALTPPRMFVPIASIPFFALISQTFFAKRCHRITGRNPFVAVLFGVLILAGFACGLFAIYSLPHGGKPIPMDDTSAHLFPFDPHASKQSELNIRYGMLSAFSIMAATDITITAVLVAKLSSMRQHWNQRTDTILTRICAFSVVTGALTSIVAGVDAVLLPLELPHNNYPYILSMSLPFFYTLCVVGSLNMRSNLGIQGETEPTGGTPHKSGSSHSHSHNTNKRKPSIPGVQVGGYFPGGPRADEDADSLAIPMQYVHRNPSTGGSSGASTPRAASHAFASQQQGGVPPLPRGQGEYVVPVYEKRPPDSLDGHRAAEKEGYWAV